MDPGDVVITYNEGSVSMINIASLIVRITIKRSATYSKVKPGRVIRSSLHKIANQEKNAISMTLYMKTYDRYHDKYNFFSMSVCEGYSFKKFLDEP